MREKGGRRGPTISLTNNNGKDAATRHRLIDFDRIRLNKKQKLKKTRKEMCVLREKKQSLKSKILRIVLIFFRILLKYELVNTFLLYSSVKMQQPKTVTS